MRYINQLHGYLTADFQGPFGSFKSDNFLRDLAIFQGPRFEPLSPNVEGPQDLFKGLSCKLCFGKGMIHFGSMCFSASSQYA